MMTNLYLKFLHSHSFVGEKKSTKKTVHFSFTAASTAVCLDHVQEINWIVKAAFISIFILTLGQTNAFECNSHELIADCSFPRLGLNFMVSLSLLFWL